MESWSVEERGGTVKGVLEEMSVMSVVLKNWEVWDVSVSVFTFSVFQYYILLRALDEPDESQNNNENIMGISVNEMETYSSHKPPRSRLPFPDLDCTPRNTSATHFENHSLTDSTPAV